jgi:two-component system response regulator HydG
MSAQQTILVVDDDTAHRAMLRTLLGGWGYAVREADDGDRAVAMVAEGPYDLILMDVRMIKLSGLEALRRVKALNPAIPVIIMTAYASVETAVEALQNGAYDYLTKPPDFDKLKITLERAMEHAMLKAENRRLKDGLAERFDRRHIIGSSPALERLLETVAYVAPSEATVLIAGESGTGKELIAGAVHYNSARREGPFVKINCAAITETLFESELFGHEKGAFTGAERRKEGRFVQADGGTLFLDEISAMPLTMQVKLLRVLQERELTRVGGEALISVDVRVMAATNRDIEALIRQGQFREDLYYRVNVVRLDVPPLRERREDVPLLAEHFLRRFAEKNRKPVKGITPQAMDLLIRYSWPGNVRELMNTMERGVVLARGDYLGEADLPMITNAAPSAADVPPGAGAATDVTLETVEKRAILQALEAAGGNKSEAARRLGITRKTLRNKIKNYGRPS